MTRLNVLLLIALVFSAIYLVRVSHESRRLFAELDKERTEERTLGSDFERLKSDKQSQATPLRVEKMARDKLAMRSATPAVTQYVNAASGASGATGSAQ
jgi:cell division protein FtsL